MEIDIRPASEPAVAEETRQPVTSERSSDSDHRVDRLLESGSSSGGCHNGEPELFSEEDDHEPQPTDAVDMIAPAVEFAPGPEAAPPVFTGPVPLVSGDVRILEDGFAAFRGTGNQLVDGRNDAGGNAQSAAAASAFAQRHIRSVTFPAQRGAVCSAPFWPCSAGS